MHDADVPLGDSVHCAALNRPTPLLLKLTVPAGAVAVPGEISLTVAVQRLRTGSTSWQLRFVLVARITVMCTWLALKPYTLSPS